ncbi:hypothetical protein KPS64_gp10 [Shigella phage KPS64]|uniref:Uncharacterized protein n=5 Tax=Mooglevirus TaxID=1985303 RepID=A0A482JJ86_9CAUD|nr:hypothetical protein KPS64_gp10 [Shigella phage KPS64]
MAGKATVNGEQNRAGFQRGEIMTISCNSSLFGEYKVNPNTLEDWQKYTKSLFDTTGLDALKKLAEVEVFRVKYKSHMSNFYATNIVEDDKVVSVTEEELKQFCIKL